METTCFCIRSMTETECSYAQIEKGLASTWACEKLSSYVCVGDEIPDQDRSQATGATIPN